MCFVANYTHSMQWIGGQRGKNYRQCKNIVSLGVYLNERYTPNTIPSFSRKMHCIAQPDARGRYFRCKQTLPACPAHDLHT